MSLTPHYDKLNAALFNPKCEASRLYPMNGNRPLINPLNSLIRCTYI